MYYTKVYNKNFSIHSLLSPCRINVNGIYHTTRIQFGSNIYTKEIMNFSIKAHSNWISIALNENNTKDIWIHGNLWNALSLSLFLSRALFQHTGIYTQVLYWTTWINLSEIEYVHKTVVVMQDENNSQLIRRILSGFYFLNNFSLGSWETRKKKKEVNIYNVRF